MFRELCNFSVRVWEVKGFQGSDTVGPGLGAEETEA